MNNKYKLLLILIIASLTIGCSTDSSTTLTTAQQAALAELNGTGFSGQQL